jgi:hypothetical protein
VSLARASPTHTTLNLQINNQFTIIKTDSDYATNANRQPFATVLKC